MFENLPEARKEIEPKLFRAIHQGALRAVEELQHKEANLICAIQEVDESFTYRYLGFNSLFRYCVEALHLTEAQSVMYIAVARKSKKLPSLQQALEDGEVTVSKASRVVSVMNEENQEYWLDLLENSTKREIEKEVAKINPRAATPEKTRYLNDTTIELQISVSEEVFDLIKRAQELISQKNSRPVKLEEVLKTVTQTFLEKNDPLEREKRRLKRQERKQAKIAENQFEVEGGRKQFEVDGGKKQFEVEDGRKQFEAENNKNQFVKLTDLTLSPEKNLETQNSVTLRHGPGRVKQTLRDKVLSRDGGRCTFQNGGKRCTERVFLHIHHVLPRENGGNNEFENLSTLCSSHHKVMHGEFH